MGAAIWLARLSECAGSSKLLLLAYVMSTRYELAYLGLDATNPVFGVSENARLKPVSSATETS